MPAVSSGAIWTVYLICLMDTLNFGIVFPLLPSIANSFNASAAEVGSLATGYSIAQVLCTPLLGRASDRFGRRPVLLLSVLGTTLSSVVTGCSWNFPILLVARVINGASGATAGIANAYIADVTTSEEKPVYISYLSAANSIGIIIGPAVGGVLTHWGFSVACYVSAGLSFLNLVLGVFTLTESNVQAREATVALNDGAAAEAATGDAQPSPASPQPRETHTVPKSAYLLYASGFLFTMGFAAFEAVTGYYLKDTFFDNDATKSGQFYGGLFVVAGVTMLVNAVIFYKPLMRCMGESLVCCLGALLRTLGFVGQALAPTVLLFTVATVTQVFGSNLIMPTTSSKLTQICDKSIYGRALGYSQAWGAVARVIAPVIFGQLYDTVSHTFAFYINAGTGVLGVLLILLVPRPRAEEDQGPTAEDVNANVDTFERSQSVTIEHAAMHETVLVRRNSKIFLSCDNRERRLTRTLSAPAPGAEARGALGAVGRTLTAA